jgi:hypothetical protein
VRLLKISTIILYKGITVIYPLSTARETFLGLILQNLLPLGFILRGKNISISMPPMSNFQNLIR